MTPTTNMELIDQIIEKSLRPNHNIPFHYGFERSKPINIIAQYYFKGLNEVNFYNWTLEEINKNNNKNLVAIFKLKIK